jgi:cysteinyl-tRNA synthetase
MPIRIYDTMTRTKKEFVPLNGRKVGMYVCGLTVYDRMHIGHARTFIFFDIVAKFLRYSGYDVKLIVNITDVDDKIIARAANEGVKPEIIATRYASYFIEDMNRLHINSVTMYPSATEHIGEIIEIVRTLESRGHAYAVEGDVFFDISTSKNYGRLSGQSLDQIIAGARVEVDKRKRNPADFALWKSAKPGEISWKSPWGDGRPGWHIECTAMSIKHLGETIDIHGGAEDLIFPHHENEIQQSEAFTGKTFVRFWMHAGLLNTSGEKMSKSLHNFVTVEELLSKYTPEAIRFFCANSIYRRQIEFSSALLEESEQGRRRLLNAIASVMSSREGEGGEGIASELLENFREAMEDDFNTRDAIASVFTSLRRASQIAEAQGLSASAKEEIISAVREINSVLCIFEQTAFSHQIDERLNELLNLREEARRRRDFSAADAIRREIEELGYSVEDTQQGPRLKRKSYS